MSTNLAIVKKWYTDLDKDLLSDDCEWRIAEGFPAGGTYQGKHAIFEDFFPRLVAHFSQWGGGGGRVLRCG